MARALSSGKRACSRTVPLRSEKERLQARRNELLATMPPQAVTRAADQLRERFGTALTDIGEIRAGRGLTAVLEDGTERPLEPKGWDHFAQ